MKRFLLLVLCSLLLAGANHSVRALTVLTRDFDELVARADTVFKGTVTAKDSQWTGEGSARHIVTFVTFHVEETYKGAPAADQTLRFLGGTVGGKTLSVPDMPTFEVGQKGVMFVVNNGKQFCPLVGIGQGRFHVVKDSLTGRERVFTDEHLPVVSTGEIGKVDEAGVPRLKRHAQTGAQAMAADDFRAEILGKVAALGR